EGLVQSQVRCLAQDSRGFIWAGTLGGLSRFDGREFKNYSRKDGLLNNQINCIIELKDGTIAVGSNGSFSLINGVGIKSIPLEGKLQETTINTLFQSGDTLWIGAENGLCLYSFLEEQLLAMDNDFEPLIPAHIKSVMQRKN